MNEIIDNTKEFILPEYWYIKIEFDNIDLITQWRKDNFNLTGDISNCFYVNQAGWRAGVIGLVGCFVELSTEQFKEHVLKLPKSKPIKEDYSYLIEFLKKIQ